MFNSILKKITFSAIMSILIVGLSIIAISTYSTNNLKEKFMEDYRDHLYEAKKEELKTLVNLAVEIGKNTYYQQMKQGFSIEHAREILSQRFASMKFFEDKSGYFFVYELDGVAFSMPDSSLIGKNLSYLQDSKGKYFLKELISKAENGGGFVNYEYTKPNENTKISYPKIAYSARFNPVKEIDLMIGTGIYVDNIEKDILDMKLETEREIKINTEILIVACVSLVLCILIFVIFLVKHIVSKPLKEIEVKTHDLSSGNGDLTKELPENKNFKRL